MSEEQIVSTSDVRKALNSWQKPSGTPKDLLSSLLLVQELLTAVPPPPLPRHATNDVLLAAIDILDYQSPNDARILRLRFIENIDAQGVANRLGYVRDTIYHQQMVAIKAITAIINKQEHGRRAIRMARLENDLEPSTYSHLFGTQEQQKKLYQRILADDSDWVIGVTGIGGLGKTAITDSVVRQVLTQFYFERAIWVRLEPDTANGRFPTPDLAYETLLTRISHALWPNEAANLSRQERQYKLRHQLAQQPYLIIVDNLEDPADTAYIVERMHDMTAPSKLLITSRARPQTGIPFYLLTLTELAETDAHDLMRHHAREKGIQYVLTATKDELHVIYQTIGGNPYALKLVVDLLDIWPLPDLISNLERGSNGSPQKLYSHIYRQTWLSLSEPARLLLQAMPLVADSGSVTQLQRITGLDDLFWTAVQELRHRSLIEVRGTLQEKRYGIHRLTNTFLSTEINDWDGDEEE